MNSLILIVGNIKHESFGVIKTPMFPNSYYGGKIVKLGEEYMPADNSMGFFANEDDALNHAEMAKVSTESYYKRMGLI